MGQPSTSTPLDLCNQQPRPWKPKPHYSELTVEPWQNCLAVSYDTKDSSTYVLQVFGILCYLVCSNKYMSIKRNTRSRNIAVTCKLTWRARYVIWCFLFCWDVGSCSFFCILANVYQKSTCMCINICYTKQYDSDKALIQYYCAHLLAIETCECLKVNKFGKPPSFVSFPKQMVYAGADSIDISPSKGGILQYLCLWEQQKHLLTLF